MPENDSNKAFSTTLEYLKLTDGKIAANPETLDYFDRAPSAANAALFSAIILYLECHCPHKQRTIDSIRKLLSANCTPGVDGKSRLQLVFEELEKSAPESPALRQFKIYEALSLGI